MVARKMDCHGATHVGRSRESNEDQFLIADLIKAARILGTSLAFDDHTEVAGPSQGKVFMVADGVGGHAAGERASAVAIEEMVNFMVDRLNWHAFQQSCQDVFGEQEAGLKAAMRHCQDRIHNEAHLNPNKQGMATTLTMALLDWPMAHIVHAGDSRCYVFRDRQLQQITSDHTIAQALVNDGVMSPQEASRSHLNNAICNVLGGSQGSLDPEVYLERLQVNDVLLLCTDGLTKHVSDGEIGRILARDAPATELSTALIDAANAGGGSDNITVVVARFVGESSSTCYAEEMVSLQVDDTVALPKKGHPSTECRHADTATKT